MTRGILALAVAGSLAAVAVASSGSLAQGVGDASWTPSRSTTTTEPSRFLVDGDSLTFRTEATWDRGQVEGLQRYTRDGLRYTLEVNDRRGRLSATGYWATNHPDPAYDRDDDDGDGRWEEAEIIAGGQPPQAGRAYTSLVQFSRWHPKRNGGACGWAWDRRLGSSEILSQLSRDLLGEWQAERFTLGYDSASYPRVGARPELGSDVPVARCRDPRAGRGRDGYIVTFNAPLGWAAFLDRPGTGSAKWTAFEAIGTSPADELTWTCGGPISRELGLAPCDRMGVDVEGVTAAVGYFDAAAADALRADAAVADVEELRDTLTDLLFDVGGFGVVRPGLTVNDRYWELFLAD